MGLRDPVVVFNAANNLEAITVRQMLLNAGIEAHVVEDVSQVGAWMFGLLPQVHKPQVFVGRGDVLQAKPLLEEYLKNIEARHRAGGAGDLVETTCEECHETSTFPASRRGHVETCTHCGAYVDVGDDSDAGGWNALDIAEAEGDVHGSTS